MHWWQIAEAQHGVITHRQLISGGRGTDAIDAATGRGELTRLTRGVYLVGGSPLTTRARLWAGVLSTNGVLFGPTAGTLWGLHDTDVQLVHVHVPHARRVSIPDGVRVHRCSAGGGVTERSGLPCFGRSTTVLDLLALLRPLEASRLADRALQRGWIAQSDVAARLKE